MARAIDSFQSWPSPSSPQGLRRSETVSCASSHTFPCGHAHREQDQVPCGCHVTLRGLSLPLPCEEPFRVRLQEAQAGTAASTWGWENGAVSLVSCVPLEQVPNLSEPVSSLYIQDRDPRNSGIGCGRTQHRAEYPSDGQSSVLLPKYLAGRTQPQSLKTRDQLQMASRAPVHSLHVHSFIRSLTCSLSGFACVPGRGLSFTIDAHGRGGGTGPVCRKAWVPEREGLARRLAPSLGQLGAHTLPRSAVSRPGRTGRLGSPVSPMSKWRLRGIRGHPPTPLSWHVGGDPALHLPAPLVLFQAHSLCPEVLCPGAKLHLH